MRVLICLLSEQHVPNLLSVHHHKPDQLVLVESTQMKSRSVASHFLKALELGNLDYDARHHIEPLAAEDNLAAARQALQRAYGKFSSAEWIANLTGGTKPMSIATYEFFKALGGKLVYTNVARPASLIDMESGGTEECTYRLSIKEFLAGYGFESRKADDKMSEAEQRARDWVASAKLLAQHACDQDILSLSDDERAMARKKGWDIQPGQLTTASPDVASALRDAFSLQGSGTEESLHGRIDKYGVEFLTGGWLEVFLWELLSRHADALGLWDVRLGLEVGRREDSGSPNEFDVSFMREYGLGVIECKSGSQAHDPGSDILYKIEAVTRQFRALRVRSYLATTGSNVLDASGNLKASVKNRASIYNCRIVTAAEINQIANAGDDTPNAINRLLFNTTDSNR